MRGPMQRPSALIVALFTIALSVTIPTPALAQEPPKQKPTEQPPPPRAPEPIGQSVNIRLDLTITDQTGSGEPIRKVVTMVVADRGNGSIRSTGSVRTQGRVQINMDAHPQILPSGGIRLALGLEYTPRTLGNDSPTEWSTLNEQIQTVLEPGKPLVVSQAADPASDRKIMVEVRATVMK
jgi:hypothetical protein